MDLCAQLHIYVKLMCFDKRKSDVIDNMMIATARNLPLPAHHGSARFKRSSANRKCRPRPLMHGVTEIWGQGDGPQYGK